jgi:hypothetical protein
MALIQCHECSTQVSDHAQTCPKCGAPVIATIERRRGIIVDLNHQTNLVPSGAAHFAPAGL